jgi:hypothetical protein
MAAARQKEMNESITDVTTTTFVARLAGFIEPPGIWKNSGPYSDAAPFGTTNVVLVEFSPRHHKISQGR